MSDSPPKGDTKGLTQEAFDLLLSKLDADRDLAGEKYLLLRLRLVTYFQARRCPVAEELADETLNRVARKIARGEEPRSLPAFSYGFARNVWREYLKAPGNEQAEIEELAPVNFQGDEVIEWEEQLTIFARCLRQLPEDEARLLIEYWHHKDVPNSDARKEIAKRLGLSATALRIRITRIKSKVKACRDKHLAKKK